MRTFRFKQYINGDFVTLELKDGQTLTHATSGPTDEGFTSEVHTWSRDGDVITLEYFKEERDCDGYLSYGATLQAAITEPLNEYGCPVFARIESEVNDEYARLSNY